MTLWRHVATVRQMRTPDLPEPIIVSEVRRLLREAGVTQYALRRAGLSGKTSQILAGTVAGTPSVASMELALGLLCPPRRLWHARKP